MRVLEPFAIVCQTKSMNHTMMCFFSMRGNNQTARTTDHRTFQAVHADIRREKVIYAKTGCGTLLKH